MKKYAVFALMLCSCLVFASENNDHHTSNNIHISKDLRTLLNQEMQEISKGMASLVLSVSSGKWHEIEETGEKIKNSYILNKKLTKHQRHELQQALPEDFKQLDQKFHHYAGMLSHAAEQRDIELVNYYVYKMNEACASCHAKFAGEKFPGFFKSKTDSEHGH